MNPGKLRLLGPLYRRFLGRRNGGAAGTCRKSMGCAVTATLLHAEAAKDGATKNALGKVVEVSGTTLGSTRSGSTVGIHLTLQPLCLLLYRAKGGVGLIRGDDRDRGWWR
jgi:hypothetical protein